VQEIIYAFRNGHDMIACILWNADGNWSTRKDIMLKLDELEPNMVCTWLGKYMDYMGDKMELHAELRAIELDQLREAV